MNAADMALRLLFFLPLVAAAVLVVPADGGSWGAGPLVAASLVYARLFAFLRSVRGREEALLAVQVLPFFAYAALVSLDLSKLELLVLAAEAASGAGLILSFEDTILPDRDGFAFVLLFSALAAGLGLAIAALAPSVIVTGGGLGILLLLFVRGRRER